MKILIKFIIFLCLFSQVILAANTADNCSTSLSGAVDSTSDNNSEQKEKEIFDYFYRSLEPSIEYTARLIPLTQIMILQRLLFPQEYVFTLHVGNNLELLYPSLNLEDLKNLVVNNYLLETFQDEANEIATAYYGKQSTINIIELFDKPSLGEAGKLQKLILIDFIEGEIFRIQEVIDSSFSRTYINAGKTSDKEVYIFSKDLQNLFYYPYKISENNSFTINPMGIDELSNLETVKDFLNHGVSGKHSDPLFKDLEGEALFQAFSNSIKSFKDRDDIHLIGFSESNSDNQLESPKLILEDHTIWFTYWFFFGRKATQDLYTKLFKYSESLNLTMDCLPMPSDFDSMIFPFTKHNWKEVN